MLEAEGYDYIWRPPFGESDPAEEWYAWFIKRNTSGRRTHHIHMVEADSGLWERLRFRDYLRSNPETAQQYVELKTELARKYQNDRIAYTKGKSEFIAAVMKQIAGI